MKDFMKIGLFAAAGFLLVRNQFAGMFSQGNAQPGPAAPQPPQPAVVTTPAAIPVPAPAYTAPTPAVPVPANTPHTAINPNDSIGQMATAAACGDRNQAAILNGIGVRLGADEWNWFRARGGCPQTDVDLFPPDNRGYAMTASEYLDRRAGAGLQGVALIGRRA